MANLPLRIAQKNTSSLEVRKRANRLLIIGNSLFGHSMPYLQALRALQVLERIGGRKAKQILKKVGSGTGSVRQTIEANAALGRLTKGF
jgi:hypothetical protein